MEMLVMLDTTRIISAPQSGGYRANIDTTRNVYGAVRKSVDTKRIVSQKISKNIDAKRRLTGTLKDMKSINVSLTAKTLTDTYSAVAFDNVSVDQVIKGTLKNWPYEFNIDEVSHNTHDSTKDIKGSYDINDKISATVNGSIAYANRKSAVALTSHVAGVIGKTALCAISDFVPVDIITPTDEQDESKRNQSGYTDTYAGLISKLYGWTDRVPNMLVNVYERPNGLHCRQRGNETGTVAIAATECSYRNITSRRLNLLTAGHPTQLRGGDPDSGVVTYLNGTFGTGDAYVVYSNGLMIREYNQTETEVNISDYTYSASKPPARLVFKQTTRNARNSARHIYDSLDTYAYGTKGEMLWQESESRDYKKTSTGAGLGVKSRTVTFTKYVALGQGLWAAITTTKTNDKLTGTSTTIQTGNAGSGVSGYSIKKDSVAGFDYPVIDLPAKYTGDAEFPVGDIGTLTAIKNAILYLNGKIEERVAVDYYGDTIIDFDKTITLLGNVYYLERNNITQSERRFEQKLELVRWY